jgi:hypothetical protein
MVIQEQYMEKGKSGTGQDNLFHCDHVYLISSG